LPAAKFIGRYLEGFQRALAQVPPEAVEKVVALLEGALERKATVFIAGNGGSASLASHLACDLEKTASGPRPRLAKRRLRAHSLNDNMATLTAWANDEGYELVFSEQLRAQAEPGDILVVISASGNSPNIVAALETAAELGLHTVALVGFDGGRALQLAELALHIPVKEYGVVEGAHAVLTHTITACLIANLAERAPASAAPPLLRVHSHKQGR
jgi:D-sedoheptulose 7-phosphate isomerase